MLSKTEKHVCFLTLSTKTQTSFLLAYTPDISFSSEQQKCNQHHVFLQDSLKSEKNAFPQLKQVQFLFGMLPVK